MSADTEASALLFQPRMLKSNVEHLRPRSSTSVEHKCVRLISELTFSVPMDIRSLSGSRYSTPERHRNHTAANDIALCLSALAMTSTRVEQGMDVYAEPIAPAKELAIKSRLGRDSNLGHPRVAAIKREACEMRSEADPNPSNYSTPVKKAVPAERRVCPGAPRAIKFKRSASPLGRRSVPMRSELS